MEKGIKNLHVSIPRIPDQVNSNGVVLVPAVTAITPCVVSRKFQIRLTVTSWLFHYYLLINNELLPPNLNYMRFLKGF